MKLVNTTRRPERPAGRRLLAVVTDAESEAVQQGAFLEEGPGAVSTATSQRLRSTCQNRARRAFWWSTSPTLAIGHRGALPRRCVCESAPALKGCKA